MGKEKRKGRRRGWERLFKERKERKGRVGEKREENEMAWE